jgi:hypothetical protein
VDTICNVLLGIYLQTAMVPTVQLRLLGVLPGSKLA